MAGRVMKSGRPWIVSLSYGARALAGKGLIALVFAGLLAIWAARPVVAADVRLLGFGDSLTAGYGLAQGEGLVPQLNAWLAARPKWAT